MKIMCYNKATKRKKQPKNVSFFQKPRKEKETNAQLSSQPTRIGAETVGMRPNTNRKVKNLS